MKTKAIWAVVTCWLVSVFVPTPWVLAGSMETTPPKHGGTITISYRFGLTQWDPYRYEATSNYITSFVLEKPLVANWGVDRGEYDFPTARGGTVLKYLKGNVIETWEVPDPLTYILHVRKGVKWQNVPPVNGREFTAQDAVFGLKRICESQFAMGRVYTQHIESLTALDDYTVQMKIKPPPKAELERGILDNESFWFVAPETVGPRGQIEDWKRIIGTGPYVIDKFVADSSVTLKRNPDYWAYDELHPANRLPYADNVIILTIGDASTELSALRTGKIDHLGGLEWQDAESLKKSNPELKFRQYPHAAPNTYRMRVDHKPFDDKRVRHAVLMGIDRETIARTYYGGYAIPYGSLVNPVSVDAYTPWEKLPPHIKDLLGYNPEKAKKLLAEAGYPKGFKTHIDYSKAAHLPDGLTEILAAYLRDIGIEAQLRLHEYGAFNALRLGGKHTQIIIHWNSQYTNPLHLLGWFADPKEQYNLSAVDDPKYTKMYNEALSILDYDERMQKARELDMYCIDYAFYIPMPYSQHSTAWQPWLTGYRGEGCLGEFAVGALFARIGVDQEMKKARNK